MDIRKDLISRMANVQKEYWNYCYEAVGDPSLKMTEVICMMFLHRKFGDTAGGIAKKYLVSASLISKSVESLRKKGLLVSERDEADSRVWHLRLTEKAQPVTEKLSAAHEFYVGTLLRGVSEEELETLGGVAEKFRENLETIRKSRP
jgi:DNA-binding MarR family transcriptional regulator